MIGRVQLGFAGTKMQFSNFPLEFYFHPTGVLQKLCARHLRHHHKEKLVQVSYSITED